MNDQVVTQAVNQAVNEEIVKRLKIKLREVNRDIRNYKGDMEVDQRFRDLMAEKIQLTEKVKSLE
jgi:hypothetical protein